MCLITKDPQREYKDLLKEKNIKGVTRVRPPPCPRALRSTTPRLTVDADLPWRRRQVLGLTKLRTKFKQFEAKRQLLGMYDRFLADDRIVPMLPKLLGSKFWQRRRCVSRARPRECARTTCG